MPVHRQQPEISVDLTVTREPQPCGVQVVESVGLLALLCWQTIQNTAKPTHHQQIEQAPPASQGKMLCCPRECFDVPVHTSC